MSHKTNIAHKLPDVKLDDSWSMMCQTSIAQASILVAVVGIFVGVEFPLLFFIKADSNFPKGIGSDAKQALLALAYSGLFFSLSAAVSGLVLTYSLGKIPAQRPQELSDGEATDSPRGYEGRPLLTWVRWHWMFSLIGGIILPIVQLLIYVWLEESNFVRITLSVIAVFAALPIVFLIPVPLLSGQR